MKKSDLPSFVRPFFEAVDRGELRLAASVLTLTEVLVHPCVEEIINWQVNTVGFFYMRLK